ncbi:MAG TPA: hypothetical protein VFW11_24920 [Cyclobacteriaceae bacterium]|nr:hypothetical protein [Cyclobacteriaceae bacterium]
MKCKKFLKDLLLLYLLLNLLSCEKKNNDFSPQQCMSPELQSKFLKIMVHYSSKLAPQATHETKFNSDFNWYYDRAERECKILFCHYNKQDSSYSLLVAREARSIKPMKEGIAVKAKFDSRGGFENYNEIFRMWKMPEDSLVKRGKFLFNRMLNGEDLTLYYSRFQQDRFIEYPDDRFTFDPSLRRWRDKELDSISFQ